MINEFRTRAAAVLSETLGVSISAEENSLRNQLDNWDSLKHLELILLLEEEFNIRLSAEQVVNMNSLDDIVKRIEEHL